MSSYKITAFSGFFYVHDVGTGKLLIPKSFKCWDDAERAAKERNTWPDVVNVYRDGVLLKTFEASTAEDNPSNLAFAWLLRSQGQSVSWAIRHGGYKVEEILKDGSTSIWKP